MPIHTFFFGALWLVGAPEVAGALTLEAAIDLALAGTNDIIQAKEDVLLVDTERMQAIAAVLPRVDLGASGGGFFAFKPWVENGSASSYNGGGPPAQDFQIPVNGNQAQFGLQITGRQLIYDGGRWWTAIARTGDLATSRKAMLRAIQNDVRLRVTERFYGLEKSRRAEDTLREQVAIGGQQLERAKAMLIAGRSKPADVAIAARNASEDEIALTKQALGTAQARRALNLELGRDPTTPTVLALAIDVDSSTVAITSRDEDELIERALTNRPEMARLDAEIAVKEKEVGIQRSSYLPTFSLDGSYRRNTSRRPDRVYGDPSENFFATVDLTMRWNLFEGRANDGRVEAAEIALRKVAAERANLARQIAAEVGDRRDSLATQEKILALARASVGSASEAVRLARGLYEEGRGTVLEVRDADLRLIQAKVTAINARLDVEIAQEALRRAIGDEPTGPVTR